MDLNQRRLSPTDLQSVAIDHSAIPPVKQKTLFKNFTKLIYNKNNKNGGGGWIRTNADFHR